jgi:hypothetical protein
MTEIKWFTGAVKPCGSPVSSSTKGTFWTADRSIWAPSTPSMLMQTDDLRTAGRILALSAEIDCEKRVLASGEGAKAFAAGERRSERRTSPTALCATIVGMFVSINS